MRGKTGAGYRFELESRESLNRAGLVEMKKESPRGGKKGRYRQQDIGSVGERVKKESVLKPRSAQVIQGHLVESTIALSGADEES